MQCWPGDLVGLWEVEWTWEKWHSQCRMQEQFSTVLRSKGSIPEKDIFPSTTWEWFCQAAQHFVWPVVIIWRQAQNVWNMFVQGEPSVEIMRVGRSDVRALIGFRRWTLCRDPACAFKWPTPANVLATSTARSLVSELDFVARAIGANFMRSCAVDMHMGISQKPLLRVKREGHRAYPIRTSVWTDWLGSLCNARWKNAWNAKHNAKRRGKIAGKIGKDKVKSLAGKFQGGRKNWKQSN